MMKAWLLAVLVAAAALICGCQANLEGITDEDLKKLVLAEKYVVVLFCEFDNQSDSVYLIHEFYKVKVSNCLDKLSQ